MWYKCAHCTYSSEAWDLFQLLVSQWPQNLHTCQSQDWTPTENTILDWDINWPWHTFYIVKTGLGRDKVKSSVQFLRWDGGVGGKPWSHSLHFILNIIHRWKDHICSYIVYYGDIHMTNPHDNNFHNSQMNCISSRQFKLQHLGSNSFRTIALRGKLKGKWSETARGPENRDRSSPHMLIFHVISSF